MNGRTMVKRALLYILMAMVWVYWIWNGMGIEYTALNILAISYVAYCWISVTWSSMQEMAILEAFQQTTFVTVFFLAQDANPILLLYIIVMSGTAYGIWTIRSFIIRMFRYKKYRAKLGQVPLMGNGCAASFYFMTVALLSVYLSILTMNPYALIPFILLSIWLGVTKHRGAILGLLTGCSLYAGHIVYL